MGFYLQGLTMGLAYVAPIGMQNLFVINSALTKTRRKALLTALIVIVFDVILSLACFFGVGALIQRYEWLQLGVLAVGGAVVIRIGLGLLFPRLFDRSATKDDAAGPSSSAESSAVAAAADDHTSWWKTISTACVVTWFNPQAIVDGTLMLGAFSATLTAQQSTPFITGVETASVVWFIGVTLLISAFSHKFSPKVIEGLNKVCGGIIVAYGLKLLFDFAVAVI
ncbi:LysE/ArgO family amino acid transporter [Bifidobacterium samirii]|uniref:Translocator protein, LysE family n=1 Tax=Bifidobacterium samirii TaxID=2306974 RepID=A0A430FRB4_9BIFI|nr:LysE family transporter [Bifidobacterium samirii]RSX55399.1 translocator protein, LysE family [Bifidobacterium samirii]